MAAVGKVTQGVSRGGGIALYNGTLREQVEWYGSLSGQAPSIPTGLAFGCHSSPRLLDAPKRTRRPIRYSSDYRRIPQLLQIANRRNLLMIRVTHEKDVKWPRHKIVAES